MYKNRISRNEQSLLEALSQPGYELYGGQLQSDPSCSHMSFDEIYTAMDRLVEIGLATWRLGETPSGRNGAVKYFKITDDGLAVLRGEDL